jgi:hypothetical protein
LLLPLTNLILLIAGAALVEPLTGEESSSSQSSGPSSSKSKQRPGNIICGICGAVRFYSYIFQVIFWDSYFKFYLVLYWKGCFKY